MPGLLCLRLIVVLFVLAPVEAVLLAAEDDPRKPAAIATQDVPVVPAELFDELRPYQEMRGAGFGGWSPDGQGMLISTQFGQTRQLHRVYEPGGRREQVTFFSEPAGGRFVPGEAAGGKLLIVMDQGGTENDQVYLLDPAGEALQMLTDGKSRNRLGPVTDDGNYCVIHSNQRNGRDTDLYLADLRQPDSLSMLMETEGEYWVATDFSPDGKKLALWHYVSINETYPAILDVQSRELTLLPLPEERKIAFGTPKFSADGDSLYLTSDLKGEFRNLIRYDLRTQEYSWLSEDLQWDVDALEVDRRRGDVAFTLNEHGASRLLLLQDGMRNTLELPLGIVGGLEFSPDGKRLGFTLSRPDAPSDAYSLDLASGKLTRWTYSETGGLNEERFVAPVRIEFESFDGRRIPAWYYRPKDAGPDEQLPVIVGIHGGPESQFRPYLSSITQYYLAKLGAVIYPNVRGSAGYGKTYVALDNGPRREDSVKDIGALLDWIAEQPGLDQDRVAVAGGSYGGYMVLASLVHYSDRLACGIDRVGIASFISFLERTKAYRRDLRRAEYGDERVPEMRAIFERIDPLRNAERIEAALLVAHGENDPRVPFYEAQQIAERVRANGRNVWTVYADNEGHGFAKRDNRDYLQAVEVLFLRKNLGLD